MTRAGAEVEPAVGPDERADETDGHGRETRPQAGVPGDGVDGDRERRLAVERLADEHDLGAVASATPAKDGSGWVRRHHSGTISSTGNSARSGGSRRSARSGRAAAGRPPAARRTIAPARAQAPGRTKRRTRRWHAPPRPRGAVRHQPAGGPGRAGVPPGTGGQAQAAGGGGGRTRSATRPKWSLGQTPSTGWSKARRQSATSRGGPCTPPRTRMWSIRRPRSSFISPASTNGLRGLKVWPGSSGVEDLPGVLVAHAGAVEGLPTGPEAHARRIGPASKSPNSTTGTVRPVGDQVLDPAGGRHRLLLADSLGGQAASSACGARPGRRQEVRAGRPPQPPRRPRAALRRPERGRRGRGAPPPGAGGRRRGRATARCR